MSVNTAWKGRRYRSDAYEKYRSDLFYLIPRPKETFVVPLKCTIYVGLKTHKTSDVDNVVKPLLDILGEIGYYEDDRQIYHLEVIKVPAQTPWMRVTLEPIKYDSWLSKMTKKIQTLFG